MRMLVAERCILALFIMLKQVPQLLRWMFLPHYASKVACLSSIRSSSLIASGKFLSGTRLQLVVASSSTPTKMAMEYYMFGPYRIDPKEVFYSTEYSYALVNLRPVVPGHVLVCPKRAVKRFSDLTADEVTDIWLTAQKIGSRLEDHHKASSLTLTIQDGPQAGQTVPHVHVHILPRKLGDFEKNDEIYDAIDEKEKELAQKLDLDKERKDRTPEEMAQEANEYRALFT